MAGPSLALAAAGAGVTGAAETLALLAAAWWPPPARLAVLVGLVLALGAAGTWVLARRGWPRSRLVGASAVLWLGWAALVLAGLAGLYRVDRAGWLWTQLTGYDMLWPEQLDHAADRPLAELTAAVPFLVEDAAQPGRLRIPRGIYTVAETIVIPAGSALHIEPGVMLRFAAGRSLLSYSPLEARGTAAEPILFTARHPWLKWGAVGVVDAGPSVFEHVRVEQARGAQVNGVALLGALSLVRADGTIRSSVLGHLFGKDAVYVQAGHLEMTDSVVHDVARDGLDMDGGRGEVHRNRFVNCGDEGIDLTSGMAVRVYENTILDARGGRVSADRGLEELRAANVLGYSRDD
jgi:hypothetical protein